MAEVPIPTASLDRMRAAYAQFEQLSMIVAEAMGIASGAVTSVNIQTGVFVTDGEPKDEIVRGEYANGVVEATT